MKIYQPKVILSTLLLLSFSPFANAQSTPTEKKTDAVARNVIRLLNENKPDSVYALTGDVFQSQIRPDAWAAMYKNNVTALLPFSQMEYQQSRNGSNIYKVESKAKLMLLLGLDDKGLIRDFRFLPWADEKNAPMSPADQKTDVIARKVFAFINAHQTDSVYAYAGEGFTSKISLEKFREVSEDNIYPMTPFPDPVFKGSRNGLSRYKIGQMQLLIGLDELGKYHTLLIQPYKDEAQTRNVKVLSDNPMRSRMDSIVDATMLPFMKTGGVPGLSIGVHYKNDDYFYNYGETTLGKGTLPHNDNLYQLGSITKTFTSTLLALAVVQKKVTLDKPITAFLPDSVAANPALQRITLLHLANHSSGLPRLPDNMAAIITDQDQPYEHYDKQHLYACLKGYKAVVQPGYVYEYSNLAAGLLGVILERIYGKSYEELVALYITGPAGLKNTAITLSAAQQSQMTQGYNESLRAVAPWQLNSLAAAGALNADCVDLLRYTNLQLGSAQGALGKAIALTHKVTFRDEHNIVGLAWHMHPDDEHIIQHTGGTGGFRTLAAVDIDSQISVVLLANGAAFPSGRGFELLKKLRSIKE